MGRPESLWVSQGAEIEPASDDLLSLLVQNITNLALVLV